MAEYSNLLLKKLNSKIKCKHIYLSAQLRTNAPEFTLYGTLSPGKFDIVKDGLHMNKSTNIGFNIAKYTMAIAIFGFVVYAIVALLAVGAEPSTTFSYFTIQSNILVALLAMFLVISDIVYHKKKIEISSKLPFSIILIIILNIFLTGLIYLTVLLPISLQDGTMIMGSTQFANLVLHGFVPILSVLLFIFFIKKRAFKFSFSWVFMIYPVVYWVFTLLRSLTGIKFMTDSLYPYFFLDPLYNNQGFGIVLVWVFALLAIFYLAGLLLIYVSNKLHKKELQKTQTSAQSK